MLELYDSPASRNGYKVRLLAALLGVPLRVRFLDLFRGESRTPEFLEMNPNGKIPVLRLPDGRCLAESNAILCYLAEGSPFLPEDAFARAEVLMWLFFEQYSHEPFVAVSRFIHLHTSEDSPRRTELPERSKNAHRAFAVMERRLSAHPFLVLDRPTVADVSLFAYTEVAGEGGLDLSPYPALGAWLGRVGELRDRYANLLAESDGRTSSSA